MGKDDLSKFNVSLSNLSDNLEKKYQVANLYFGEKVRTEKSDSLKDNVTDMSMLMKYIGENYADQNVGAVILASDGIYNEGKNPIYEDLKLSMPLYTIALGDTSQRKDLVVKNVLHNKIAYLGDKFAVQIDISAFNCSGGTSKLTVEKLSDGNKKTVNETTITVTANDFYTTKEITLDADQAGIIKYSITASPLNGENNYANNKKDIYVEVLDSRQKILIYANAPHPDISALTNIITLNKNYEVKSGFASGPSVNFSDFDLVIFHNLPSNTSDISEALSVLDRKQTPRWYIVGTQVNQPKFNTIQEVVNIKGNASSNEDIEPRTSSNFNLFTLSPELQNQLGKYPPLVGSFGNYEANASASILLTQRIKKIDTKYPLLGFNEKNGTKAAVFAGEGLWKWRLFDYTSKNNYDQISELINKTIQYLTVKEDRRKFRVNLAKNLFRENESIFFDAQLYNDAYEMINTPDATLSIKDSNGKEYTYSFSKTNNYYTLDAGLFPEGSYTYNAAVLYNGNSQTAIGKFSIQSIQLETNDLTARHDVLAALSKKYNGKMFYPFNVNSLLDEIMNNKEIKPVIFLNTTTKSIIHMKWIFFAIIALLALEWFLRRYHGSY